MEHGVRILGSQSEAWRTDPGNIVVIVPSGIVCLNQVDKRCVRHRRVDFHSQSYGPQADIAGLVFDLRLKVVHPVIQGPDRHLPDAYTIGCVAVTFIGLHLPGSNPLNRAGHHISGKDAYRRVGLPSAQQNRPIKSGYVVGVG